MEVFFERLAKRSILVFVTIFIVSLAIGTFLFLVLNTKAFALAAGSSDIGWLNQLQSELGERFGTVDAGGAGGFLQGVWGTAGSLAASFVAIVLAQQALVLSRKQNDSQEKQDEENARLAAEQHRLLKEQNAMRAQTIERDRSRFEFDLKRDVTEQFGPLLQSNLQVGSALNTLFVESVRLHIAVSKQVEKVMFLERAGAISLVESDVCAAIARHLDATAVESELKNVKNAMRHLCDALSLANGNPLARLAVKKQLELNSRTRHGQGLFAQFSDQLPPEALNGLAPVDHVSFAEHLRVKAFGPTPALRLVECWYQASLFGLMQQSTWMKFTREGTIEFRLDEAGKKDGVDTYSTVFNKLHQRSEAIGEGLFFLGALIALHTQTMQRPDHLTHGPDEAVWRVNVGLLALIDFYNALPSKEALKLAAKQIYGGDSPATAPPPGTDASYVEMIEKMIERLPYEHDSPDMRQGKATGDIRSVLPQVYSRIVVSLDEVIREERDGFFDRCIGPASFTPAQNAYVQVISIADLRSAGTAQEIHAQVKVHCQDFSSYVEQQLHDKAMGGAMRMLREMVDLLAFYDPYIHQLQLRELQRMHLDAIGFFESLATKGEVATNDIKPCIEVLTQSARSVSRNERLSPASRQAYSATLLNAVQRLQATSTPA